MQWGEGSMELMLRVMGCVLYEGTSLLLLGWAWTRFGFAFRWSRCFLRNRRTAFASTTKSGRLADTGSGSSLATSGRGALAQSRCLADAANARLHAAAAG